MSYRIPKNLKGKKKTGSGTSCSFYPITSRTGLKLFDELVRAKKCYNLHNTLSKNPKTAGYVPKVRSELTKIGGRWGYAVETVKVYTDYKASPTEKRVNKLLKRYLGYDEYANGDIDVSEFSALKHACREVLTSIVPEMPDFEDVYTNKECFNYFIDDVFEDDHQYNVGIRKGQVVWIDFSI